MKYDIVSAPFPPTIRSEAPDARSPSLLSTVPDCCFTEPYMIIQESRQCSCLKIPPLRFRQWQAPRGRCRKNQGASPARGGNPPSCHCLAIPKKTATNSTNYHESRIVWLATREIILR